MSDIVIFISNISVNKGQLHVNGVVYVNPSETGIGWGTDINWADPAISVNTAIVNAASAAAVNAGFTVDPLLDKRTIFGTAGTLASL